MKRRVFTVATVLVLAIMPALMPGVVRADKGNGNSKAARTAAGQPDFGPNVKIFDPSMPVSEIQATVDAIANQQVDLAGFGGFTFVQAKERSGGKRAALTVARKIARRAHHVLAELEQAA